MFNSLWRMFHVLGYINPDHSLSKWGLVLEATLAALPKSDNPSIIIELEEAAVVAVELLRLGLLNANNMFPTYSGAPYRGSEATKRNTLLVARVACFGKLSHKEIGYTGPLSRNYLGYHAMVTAVRSTLRDLAEVCLATLLSHGDAVRKRDDYTDLGLE
jgi:Temperature dependent protein affecting M2 dsRNA replication